MRLSLTNLQAPSRLFTGVGRSPARLQLFLESRSLATFEDDKRFAADRVAMSLMTVRSWKAVISPFQVVSSSYDLDARLAKLEVRKAANLANLVSFSSRAEF
jgi:hypothetical protein